MNVDVVHPHLQHCCCALESTLGCELVVWLLKKQHICEYRFVIAFVYYLVALSDSTGMKVAGSNHRLPSAGEEERIVQQSVLFLSPGSACCLIILPVCCWRTLKDTSD